MKQTYPHPLEIEAADRFANIVTSAGDPDLENFSDLIRLRPLSLRDTVIAKCLYRALRARGDDTALLLAVPDGLSLEYAERETWSWRVLSAGDGRLPMDFIGVVCTFRHWYADVLDRLHELSAADQLDPRIRCNCRLKDGCYEQSVAGSYAARRRACSAEIISTRDTSA